MRGRTAVLICLILLLLASLGADASAARSQVFMNDTGSVAYGLRVTFDRPVSITDMGQGFLTWEAEESQTVILFTDGQVNTWGDFYFFWEPGEAGVLSYEWLSSPNIRKPSPAPGPSNFFVGGEIQHYLAERTWGSHWQHLDPLEQLHRNGMEWLRVRVTTFSNPILRNTPPENWGELPWDWSYCHGGSLEYITQILQEATNIGMRLNLVFLLSHIAAFSWNQPTPPEWRNLLIEELARAVSAHCYETTRYFQEKGLDIEIYDIGNEIQMGILGYLPDLREEGGLRRWPGVEYKVPLPEDVDPCTDIDYMRENVWPIEATLLKAAINGVKEADPEGKITLHTVGFYDEPLIKEFFTTMVQQGVEFDFGGLSYPGVTSDWPVRLQSDPFSWAEGVVEHLASLGKKVIFCEATYPNTPTGGVGEGEATPIFPELDTHVAAPGYPCTPEGQAKWLRDFLSYCRQDANIVGAFYFYPDLYSGVCSAPVCCYPPGERIGLFASDSLPMPAMGQLNPDPSAFPTVDLIDETHPSLSWSGHWYRNRNEQYSGGTCKASSRSGDSVEIPFVGTGIALIYTANDNHGIAEIEIDGVRYPDIDMYSPTMEPVFRLTDVITRDLRSEEHVLIVTVSDRKNPSSSGDFVVIDAVDAIQARPEGALPDTSPPELVNLGLVVETLDTSQGPQELEIHAKVRDDDSGIAYVAVEFASPSGKEVLSTGLHLTEGTPNEGRFVGTLRFPQYTESGMWTIKRVWAGDNAFPDQNVEEWNTGQLQTRTFTTQLGVLGGERPTADVSVIGESIQQAIDEASPGDVIDIPSGVYEENLVIERSVTLRGSSADKPLISGGPQDMPVIRVESFSREIEVTLEGLRIGFAKGRDGNGISAHGKSNLHLADVELMYNEAHGIELGGQAQVTITNCLFTGMGHAAITFYGSTQGTISNCTIIGNGAYGLWIGESAEVKVTDSQISENGFTNIKFDGIYVYGNAQLTITRSEITNNCKCGIRVESPDNIALCDGNTVSGNGEGDYCGFSPGE